MLKAAPDLSSDGGCRPGSSITRLGAEERRLVCEEPREELRDEPQEELREELREVLCESLREALCDTLREELQEAPGDASCDSLRALERELEPLASSRSSDDLYPHELVPTQNDELLLFEGVGARETLLGDSDLVLNSLVVQRGCKL